MTMTGSIWADPARFEQGGPVNKKGPRPAYVGDEVAGVEEFLGGYTDAYGHTTRFDRPKTPQALGRVSTESTGANATEHLPTQSPS